MFQLIIVVIAILLMAAMIIAGMWVGGEVFSESKQRALYTEYMNAASQIEGAAQLYYQENASFPPGEDEDFLNALVAGEYLKNIPQGGWKVSQTDLYRPIDSAETCEIMNRIAGKDTSVVQCPPCGEEQYKTWPGCMIPGATEE